jgi:hypothetical protein
MNSKQPEAAFLAAFDSLSSDLDDEIDETFFQWSIDNNLDYSPEDQDQDYPNEFKAYYMANCIDP